MDSARQRHRKRLELSRLCDLRAGARKVPRPRPCPQRLLVRLAQLSPTNDDLQALNERRNLGALYLVGVPATNTSFSSVAVVPASRLSVMNTVSPFCSITTVPSSVS